MNPTRLRPVGSGPAQPDSVQPGSPNPARPNPARHYRHRPMNRSIYRTKQIKPQPTTAAIRSFSASLYGALFSLKLISIFIFRFNPSHNWPPSDTIPSLRIHHQTFSSTVVSLISIILTEPSHELITWRRCGVCRTMRCKPNAPESCVDLEAYGVCYVARRV